MRRRAPPIDRTAPITLDDAALAPMIAGNSHVYLKYGVYRIASPTEAINSVLYDDARIIVA